MTAVAATVAALVLAGDINRRGARVAEAFSIATGAETAEDEERPYKFRSGEGRHRVNAVGGRRT